MPQLLTVEAVADLLSVSKRTVQRLVEAGELRSCSIRRASRIPAEDVLDYIGRLLGENKSATQPSQQVVVPTTIPMKKSRRLKRPGDGLALDISSFEKK